jgi:hypothetical protein
MVSSPSASVALIDIDVDIDFFEQLTLTTFFILRNAAKCSGWCSWFNPLDSEHHLSRKDSQPD